MKFCSTLIKSAIFISMVPIILNTQEVLRPKGFIDFISERHICISMAASIHDVCKRHPDRGVDLILSVQVLFLK